MNEVLRIIVADDEPRMREFYQEVLPLMGHDVVCAAASGKELIEGCARHRPHLIITDIRMPDMSGLDAAQEICRLDPLPVILVSAHDDAEFIDRAAEIHVLAYLIKPIKRQDLQPAIHIAVRRFEEFQSLRKEATDLRQALQDRKLIERAKGIIMKQTNLDEAAAFRSLQKLARDKNRKLAQVAEMIVTAAEVLEMKDDRRETRGEE